MVKRKSTKTTMGEKMTTKAEIAEVAGKTISYLQLLNLFLYNCVIKGIVSFNDLTNREKKNLIKILEGKNERWHYQTKLKRIVDRKNKHGFT